ncbi:unnamed protein product [Didymodactylos carnosus]|uniref:TauD/TfdA-like domain-containing protein n=1 Tax=Didymodactylos carnosus TaxID=1234261 RepID=A0A815HRA0_9BILA|nr:unnamed protein product [Didymodactylos carnosus]CAF4226526.1 unnamed protein product [Didymodactylos carnosus]
MFKQVLHYFGTHSNELIRLVNERFVNATSIISLQSFTFLRSCSIYFHGLLHNHTNTRISIVHLIGTALRMKVNGLNRLILVAKDHHKNQSIFSTAYLTTNQMARCQVNFSVIRDQSSYLLEDENKSFNSQILLRSVKQNEFHKAAPSNIENNETNKKERNSDETKRLIVQYPAEPTKPIITIIPTGASLGAEILSVDLRTINNDDFKTIYRTWLDHLVLLFRDQQLSDDDLIAFSRRFGELDWAPVQENGRRFVDGHPELYIVSNVVENGVAIGSLGAGEAVWHTDMGRFTNDLIIVRIWVHI